MQSGCCEPPKDCNFNRTSSEVWVKPENGTTMTYSNIECNKWDNEPNTLCFDCESCKAGFLEDVTSNWFWLGIWWNLLEFIFMVYLIHLNVLACKQIPTSSHPYTPILD